MAQLAASLSFVLLYFLRIIAADSWDEDVDLFQVGYLPYFSQIQVLPAATDPSINNWLDPHIVTLGINIPPTDWLHVHLPGTLYSPSDEILILKVEGCFRR
jgi:hypothetical protein